MKLLSRGLLQVVLLVVVPAVLGVTLYEAHYRYRLTKLIPGHFKHSYFWVQNQALVPMEADRYFKRQSTMHPYGFFKVRENFDISVIPVDLNRSALNFSVRSNNLGFLSDLDYVFDRDPTTPEFRIVVLGESFTGPTTAAYQWVDTLEELLNASDALRIAVGNRRIRTYNHGIVGAGFHSFWTQFDTAGRRFDPDLVVVNMLEVDYPRGTRAHMVDEEEMIAFAKEHLERIAVEARDLVVTAMPLHEDLVHFDRPLPRTTKLAATMPKTKIIDMRRHMPRAGTRAIADDWTNVPYDAHYSDRGGEIYARALAHVLARHITGLEIDFTATKTRFSEEVLDPGKPRTRSVDNAAARLYKYPESLKRIYGEVITRMVRARMYRLRPYALDQVLRTGVDGVVAPLHIPLTQGFVPMRFGSGEEDVVLLNVSCTAAPVSLDNPDCFTHFHMFVADPRAR